MIFFKYVWPNVGNMNPMFAFTHKLRLLRQHVRVWNKETFGNVHQHMADCQLALQQVQSEIEERGFSDDLANRELKLHSELDIGMNKEEIFLCEKGRLK